MKDFDCRSPFSIKSHPWVFLVIHRRMYSALAHIHTELLYKFSLTLVFVFFLAVSGEC